MAYFEDLTEYSYFHAGIRTGTKNIGWLARQHQCAYIRIMIAITS